MTPWNRFRAADTQIYGSRKLGTVEMEDQLAGDVVVMQHI